MDFTPKDQAGSCWTSADWAIAAAPGKVLQAEKGRVVINLSGSDFQGTGWTLLYMHMASEDRVEIGTVLKTGDHVGHPSCEGGAAETSHLHSTGDCIGFGDFHRRNTCAGAGAIHIRWRNSERGHHERCGAGDHCEDRVGEH